MVFQRWLPPYWRTEFSASHLSYTYRSKSQCQAIVKVHRVFPSFCGYTAFSPRLQFHRVSGRDSVEIVTPFVQVGTYPTRNFATLGRYSYGRRLPGLQFGASLALTPPINLPAPGRRQSVYFVFTTSHRPMFLVNSRHHHFSAACPGSICLHFTQTSTPSSEGTGLFCRIPWPEFSRAPWIIHPTHLSWFPVRFDGD